MYHSCRYLFDHGSEQSGEYVIDEEIKEPEVEEDDTVVIKRPRWVAASISHLQTEEVEIGGSS